MMIMIMIIMIICIYLESITKLRKRDLPNLFQYFGIKFIYFFIY